MSGKPAPLRILHVVGGMKRGGAETWLMHVLRSLDRSRFHMDFLVHTEDPCAFDEEIRSMGSEIIPCMEPHRPLQYAKNFRRILFEHGPYDIVHSAVHHFSGFVLRLAKEYGVPGRIAHSHNSSPGMERVTGLARQAYFATMKRWIDRYATAGLACSSVAAESLFGAHWLSDPRWRVHYPSTDLEPFRQPVERGAVRGELGIPGNAFVIGHVGRFDLQKNHTFLLDVAHEILKRDSSAWFLLIGDGPLRAEIEAKTGASPLGNRIIFTGSRSDVPRLMLGAMDAFVLPSLHEGLPLVLVEAQAAGLPCVISDVITPEAVIVKPLVNRASLSQSHTVWADQILSLKRESRATRSESLAQVAASLFDVKNAMPELEKVYLSCGANKPKQLQETQSALNMP